MITLDVEIKGLFGTLTEDEQKAVSQQACKETRLDRDQIAFIVLMRREGVGEKRIGGRLGLSEYPVKRIIRGLTLAGVDVAKRRLRPVPDDIAQRRQRVLEMRMKGKPANVIANALRLNVSIVSSDIKVLRYDGHDLPMITKGSISATGPKSKAHLLPTVKNNHAVTTLQRFFSPVVLAEYTDYSIHDLKAMRPDIRPMKKAGVYVVGNQLLTESEMVALAEEIIKSKGD